MKVSIIIPVYNGAATIRPLVELTARALPQHAPEFVLVNDGSADRSEAVCEQLARERADVRFISLRRNFGEHNAVMCGLAHMRGEAAVIIDDDFQNPPGEIAKLLEELEKGYDVVYAQYQRKEHAWWRNLGSRLNDLAATLLLQKPANLYLCSFKAIRREVADEIVKYRGPFPYVDGLILRVTRNLSSVPAGHAPRREGRSGYTPRKLVRLWLNMFLNFSILPLRLFTLLGAAVFAAGAVLSCSTVIEKISNPHLPLGYASLFVAVLLLAGVQILFLGLIGEYLGKQYLDQNGTPQWVIKKAVPPLSGAAAQDPRPDS